MPSSSDIIRFIDNSVVKSILKFWISNLKPNYLEDDEFTFKALKKFVRMAIEIHLKHLLNGDKKTRYTHHPFIYWALLCHFSYFYVCVGNAVFLVVY